MTYNQYNPLLQDLERVARSRTEIANHLQDIADSLTQSELEAEIGSGKLSLESDIEDITVASKNLRRGVFRLLVLGDLKRGKSTFLNALIGEKILPSDVNPCTALLTVLRYGKEKKVIVYFKNEQRPEQLDFDTFKTKYTIDPDESKRLEGENKQAFPHVDHAVVEYPLSLLEKGIEIIDSPGLNDTEARNRLSLSYINNCHAILFVFRAIQPCTLDERRYLENYIKGRGINVFFLLNAWDEIRKELIDPDNIEELEQAEAKLRQVFRTNLLEYCQTDTYDFYEQRVFELSSLMALRQRIKNPEDSLEGTGFSQFIQALNNFLTQERAVSEFRQVKTLARQTYQHTHEAIERRIPLMEENVTVLKQKIDSVEPEFAKLTKIRDQFQEEIRISRQQKSNSIANSCKNYILNLSDSFEADFVRYQPNLGFLDFLSQGKREEFEQELKQAFERYITEKMSAWERHAEQELEQAFSELSQRAEKYGESYQQILDSITEKLIGKQLYLENNSTREESPAWTRWAIGFFSLASGNIGGVALAAAGFDWKNILVNWLAVIGISSFLVIFTGVFFGPVGIALMSLGVGAVQAEQARQDFLKTAKKEFTKSLPTIAKQQREPIYQAVQDCFNNYELEVMKRINEDIKSRKSELENLLKQKESREIDRDGELKRLKGLDAQILAKCHRIESIYEDYIAILNHL